MWPNLRASPDRALSRSRYRQLSTRYDDSCRYLGEVRRNALDILALARGETVFDVGCGTGAMLPALAKAVGSQGRVLGIEHSSEMVAIARTRIETPNGARCVSLVQASVEEAIIPFAADAVLFCYTHDVLQSPDALRNVFRHVRPGARVVVAGSRFLPWWWGAPINLWVCLRGWRYHTTYQGFREPWRPLLTHCPDLRIVGHYHAGTSYLAVGHVPIADDASVPPAG